MSHSSSEQNNTQSAKHNTNQSSTPTQSKSKGCAHPVMMEGGVLNPEVQDYVDSPAHYTGGEIECIQAIEAMLETCDDGYEGYLRGQIIKYTWRFRQKKTLQGMELAQGQEDLQKAQWYQHRLMDYNVKREARAMMREAEKRQKLQERIAQIIASDDE